MRIFIYISRFGIFPFIETYSRYLVYLQNKSYQNRLTWFSYRFLEQQRPIPPAASKPSAQRHIFFATIQHLQVPNDQVIILASFLPSNKNKAQNLSPIINSTWPMSRHCGVVFGAIWGRLRPLWPRSKQIGVQSKVNTLSLRTFSAIQSEGDSVVTWGK